MFENKIISTIRNRPEVVWQILAIAAALIIMVPSAQKLMQDAPTEERIVDIVLGMLILILIFVPKFVSWFEDSQSAAADQFGLSDWAVLTITGIWVIVGAWFVSVGISPFEAIAFVVFGTIGLVGMIYKLYTVRGSIFASVT